MLKWAELEAFPYEELNSNYLLWDWHASIIPPSDDRNKMERICLLTIVFLNEGALSRPVPRVVAVSVATADCTGKEVVAQKSLQIAGV